MISVSRTKEQKGGEIFLKQYLSHIQNSVFEGEISKVQLMKLQNELKPYIDKSVDSVIIFKSRQERWMEKDFWGKEDDMTDFML